MNDCVALGIWYFQGLLTPAIACVVAYIAWQQSRTAAGKVKLDLFDRRFRVLEEVRKILGIMTRNGDVTGDEIALFRSETMPAEFLMGPEVKEYLDEVYKHAVNLHSAKEQLRGLFDTHASSEMREKPANAQEEEMNWVMNQFIVVKEKFRKYLDISKL